MSLDDLTQLLDLEQGKPGWSLRCLQAGCQGPGDAEMNWVSDQLRCGREA